MVGIMNPAPGITRILAKQLPINHWIVNPFNPLDNFQVTSIEPTTRGTRTGVEISGRYVGSEVIHKRSYRSNDNLLSASFNPRTAFKTNDKSSSQWAAIIKEQGSTTTSPENVAIEWLYNPSKNKVGRIYIQAGATESDIKKVSYDDITEEWSVKECRHLDDSGFSMLDLPVDSDFVSLRNSTTSTINDVMTPKNIELYRLAKATLIASNFSIREVQIATYGIRVVGVNLVTKHDATITVNLNGDLSVYSYHTPMKMMVEAIMRDNAFIYPMNSLKAVFEKYDLELRRNGYISYNNKNLGYHYNDEIDSEDSRLSTILSSIKSALREVLGVSTIKADICTEYGGIDIDLADLFNEADPSHIIHIDKNVYMVNDFNGVKSRLMSKVADFSVKNKITKPGKVSFSNMSQDDIKTIISLNSDALKAVEDKLKLIRNNGIREFSKADIIQGMHTDNFGIADLYRARDSINEFLCQAKEHGLIHDNNAPENGLTNR
jgi:hypothetical protein